MVKASLNPGLSAQKTVTTTNEMSAGHLPVYSTPSMIGLMEHAARDLLQEHLDDGETSVGYRVDVRHLAATPIGKQVTVTATLRELIDGRKAIFDVEAYNEDGVKIGDGMHERRIIPMARMGG
ncbi:MAG TPA: thioesterase family protein [Dehalococcoidia bacterium]|nr:thioesterase family protein [Dehalococcoidia bacterium]